jgi:hypothetical protein
MTFGFDGASAMSPIDVISGCGGLPAGVTGYRSKIDVHVVPLLVVFQMPPVAKPT